MTLDEFRRNWIGTPTSLDAPPPGSSSQRLTFMPPEEFELVPRLVFREVFTPPPAAKRYRILMRQWGARVVWTAAALAATAVTAVGMATVFEYAPTYIDKYLTTLN